MPTARAIGAHCISIKPDVTNVGMPVAKLIFEGKTPDEFVIRESNKFDMAVLLKAVPDYEKLPRNTYTRVDLFVCLHETGIERYKLSDITNNAPKPVVLPEIDADQFEVIDYCLHRHGGNSIPETVSFSPDHDHNDVLHNAFDLLINQVKAFNPDKLQKGIVKAYVPNNLCLKLYNANKERFDMANKPDSNIELINKIVAYYGDKREACGKPRTVAAMNDIPLSSLLDSKAPSKWFSEGGTYDEAVQRVDAALNPMIAKYNDEKALENILGEPHSDETKVDLNEEFPRDAENKPAPHWIDDASARNGFYAEIAEIAKEHQYKGNDVKQIHHTILKVDHTRDFKGTKKDAIDQIRAWFVEYHPRREDWVRWMGDNHIQSSDLLSILDIEKLSDWTKGLTEAGAILKMARENGANFNETQSQGQSVPDEPQTQKSSGKTQQERPKKLNANESEFHSLSELEIRRKYTKDLKGKKYLEVVGRILLFRRKHPTGTIVTDMLHVDDQGVIFKAQVIDGQGHVLSTGHGRATFAKSTNFDGRVFEKAETAAIGRALAHAGYGTDSAAEINEFKGDMHLADSPVELTTAA